MIKEMQLYWQFIEDMKVADAIINRDGIIMEYWLNRMDIAIHDQQEGFRDLVANAGENKISRLEIDEDCDHGKTGTTWISQNNLLASLPHDEEVKP